MRTRLSFAAALLLTAGAAQAQTPAPAPLSAPRATIGYVDLSVTSSDITGDAARFQRYRDMRDGAAADAFRFDRLGDSWRFDSGGRHVGREDQWLFAAFRNGKVKASFSWDQIPLYISADTRTPYSQESPGVFRLDDALQRAVEAGELRLNDVARGATPFDLRSRRHVAAFALVYSATRTLDVKLQVKQTRREGTQPFMGGFGFNNVVEMSAPVDTRTRDIKADAEWANERGMVRVGYDGSWFTNNVQTLVWDNPLKLSDVVSATGYIEGRAGSQGRAAFWPNSTMHGISSAGSVKLPARSRLTAQVRVGTVRQDQELLAATLNSAAPAIALPRATAEAEARTLSMNYSFTSRPVKRLWLNARYRYYDLDNRTPVFAMPQFVVMDQTVKEGVSSSYVNYTRQTFDADASVTAGRGSSIRFGYTRGIDDRTFRIFEKTTDDMYRASVDSMWRTVTFRAIVERSQRRGSGFDEQLLLEAAEQPAMRHYDVADRDRDRVTGLVQVFPHKAVALSGSVALGKDDYSNSGFGLRDNQNRVYTATIELTPAKKFAAAATYSNERYTALQFSRTAAPGPQQLDPTRDWSIDSSDRVHTVAASVDLLQILPRTDVRVTYDFTRSNAAYVYGVPPNSTLARLQQLPTVHNELRTATGDVRVHLTRNVAVGAFYWYDDYAVDDFAFTQETVGRLVTTSGLFLGSVYRPYTASAAALRLIYVW